MNLSRSRRCGVPSAELLAQNGEMLAKLHLPEGFKPVLAISFGYAVEKENAKEHTIAISRI